MAVKQKRITREKLDVTQSHVRVERSRTGGFQCTGAIAHPDLAEAAVIGRKTPVAKALALKQALELAIRFGLPHVYVVTD